MRLDADVLRWLKSKGKGYQTRINAILREAMLKELDQGCEQLHLFPKDIRMGTGTLKANSITFNTVDQ